MKYDNYFFYDKMSSLFSCLRNIILVSIICIIAIILEYTLIYELARQRSHSLPSSLWLNYEYTYKIEGALQNFKHDIGVYPIELNDLVVSDESRLKTKVKKHTFRGPYIESGNGIHDSGIPYCPLIMQNNSTTYDTVEYHWIYDSLTGKVQPMWDHFD